MPSKKFWRSQPDTSNVGKVVTAPKTYPPCFRIQGEEKYYCLCCQKILCLTSRSEHVTKCDQHKKNYRNGVLGGVCFDDKVTLFPMDEEIMREDSTFRKGHIEMRKDPKTYSTYSTGEELLPDDFDQRMVRQERGRNGDISWFIIAERKIENGFIFIGEIGALLSRNDDKDELEPVILIKGDYQRSGYGYRAAKLLMSYLGDPTIRNNGQIYVRRPGSHNGYSTVNYLFKIAYLKLYNENGIKDYDDNIFQDFVPHGQQSTISSDHEVFVKSLSKVFITLTFRKDNENCKKLVQKITHASYENSKIADVMYTNTIGDSFKMRDRVCVTFKICDCFFTDMIETVLVEEIFGMPLIQIIEIIMLVMNIIGGHNSWMRLY